MSVYIVVVVLIENVEVLFVLRRTKSEKTSLRHLSVQLTTSQPLLGA